MTNLISRSRRGREGGRESGARRERGVSILYFQRCIKHIATVTRQQQVPAQRVPRSSEAPSLPPSSLPSLCLGEPSPPAWHRAPRVGGWQRITPVSRGREEGREAGLGEYPEPETLAQGWQGGHRHLDSSEPLPDAPSPQASPTSGNGSILPYPSLNPSSTVPKRVRCT